MTKKIEREWLRTLDAARYYYKLTGDRIPAEQTVRNWMTKGKRSYDGSKIKLKYVTPVSYTHLTLPTSDLV